MAAWLTLRGREFLGSPELLAWDSWSDEIFWTDHKGLHESRHRPDLVGISPDGRPIAVEVELAPKSIARLGGILYRHAVWRGSGKTNGVWYVCGDENGCERIKKAATTGNWFTAAAVGLTVVLLDTIRAQAIEMREEDPQGAGFRRAAA